MRGLFVIAAGLALWGVPSPAADNSTGRVLYAEHFAYVRVPVGGGLGGPAKEAARDSARAFCATDGAGNFYLADQFDCMVHWIDKNGTDRVIAGDGRKGFRDGPGDQARFDLGNGSYNDAQIHCDPAGNVFISDGWNNRLRKIYRTSVGTWHVTTVSGGGKAIPKKGQWVKATDLKYGCAPRWGLSPDGKTGYFSAIGGLYKVWIQENKATVVATAAEIQRDCGYKGGVRSWHVGGGHVTSDDVYYWMPGASGDSAILRFHGKTGKAERYAGPGKPYRDGTGYLDSGFHTVFATYSPDASLIYVGGGDEFSCRRLWQGKVQHLQKDGSWKAQQNDQGNAWRYGGSGLHLGRDGKLYTIPPPYGWPAWVIRATFGKE